MGKPLAQMTREELESLDENDISELALVHNIQFPIGKRTPDNYFKALEELWNDIQQTAAEARQER